MATYCEHHSVDVDDESLLLDNENVNSNRGCVKCKQNDILWANSESNSTNVPLQGKLIREVYEDGFESPEDSPLLIQVNNYSGFYFSKLANFA